MIRTRVCDLLNIEYPVLQGAMTWVSWGEMAAAVSNAGGLGFIAAGGMTPEILCQEIRKARSLTDRPFGVNMILYLPEIEKLVEVVCQERAPVVSTGAGSPGKYMEQFKKRGIKVLPLVASVALAKRLERLGADAVIAEGTEAGGHIGELTTMVLVPQVADAVSIPVIAAGGIADGRGAAAAFALGAEGIQMGTRFAVAYESTVHERYKEMIIKAGDRDTVVTARSTGHPVRVLKNKLAREFLKLEADGADPETLEKLGSGKLRLAAVEGDVENGSVMAGQVAGLVNKRQGMREIITEVMAETEAVLAGLRTLSQEVRGSHG